MTKIPKGAYTIIAGKRHRLTRPKKSRRKILERELDEAFSLFIRRRDKKCFTTDKTCGGPLQCGHLFTRRSRATRWDFRFSFGQCRNHNNLHKHHPEIMTLAFIKKFGMKLYDYGVWLSHTVKKHTLAELEQLKDKFRNGEEKRCLVESRKPKELLIKISRFQKK